ncbi:MAG: hypothetical protein ACT4PJ_14040 [Gemmatimonadaceae bacterium]
MRRAIVLVVAALVLLATGLTATRAHAQSLRDRIADLFIFLGGSGDPNNPTYITMPDSIVSPPDTFIAIGRRRRATACMNGPALRAAPAFPLSSLPNAFPSPQLGSPNERGCSWALFK